MAKKNPRQYSNAPVPPDCSGTVIDGDITVDIDQEDIDQLIQQICDCIEQLGVNLTNSINAATWVEISCPPCILVDGVKQTFVTVLHNPVTGERKYLNAEGVEIDPAAIEIVTDPCDERCDCSPCGDGGVYTENPCCECSTIEDMADISQQLAEVYAA